MGINDRDYYRDDSSGGSALGRATRQDGAVKWLIIACVLTFLAQLFTQEPNSFGGLHGGVTSWGGLYWGGLKNFQIWRVVTYGFLHGNFQHLLFNMLGLWIFGRMVEGVLGSRETLAFFLMAVVVSGLCQVGVDVASDRSSFTVGASGGIYALTILAAFLFPRHPMYFFLLPIAIELRWLATIYVLLDVTGFLRGGSIADGGAAVAHLAHLGGAVFGAVYHNLGWRLWPSRFDLKDVWSAPRRAVSAARDRVLPSENPKVRIYEPPADDFEQQLDRILDKINREGKASLTSDETAFLDKASEHMRNRR